MRMILCKDFYMATFQEHTDLSHIGGILHFRLKISLYNTYNCSHIHH